MVQLYIKKYFLSCGLITVSSMHYRVKKEKEKREEEIREA